MSKKENTITSGGIETPVEGFFGNITTKAPFDPKYGPHKTPGSQNAPMRMGGRGGAGKSIEGKLMNVAFKGPGTK